MRCDNSVKNKTLKENYAINFGEINFEFTSPRTPQKNGVIERVFSTLCSRMSVMVDHARLHENINNVIWHECAATAT